MGGFCRRYHMQPSRCLKCTCPQVQQHAGAVLGSLLLVRGVPNLSPGHTCFGLFKLQTRETLQKGRGHSTWLESYYVATIIVLKYIPATLVLTCFISLVFFILHFFLSSLLFLTELLQVVLYLVVDVMSTKVKTSHAVNERERVCVCVKLFCHYRLRGSL